MDSRLRWRLSGLMALLYAMQGAFWPLLAAHLKDMGVTGRGRGWVFATLAIGSFLMPLGAGRLVDRRFAAERVLAAIFGAASLFLAAIAAGLATTPAALFGLFLVFWLITAPAFALTNALTLRHLPRPFEQFAGIRVWGTVGWMAVGWFVSLVLGRFGGDKGAHEAFGVGAVLALVLSGYCRFLPHTPPLAAPSAHTPGLLREAWGLTRRPGMAGFYLAAFGLSLTTPYMFQVLPTYLEARGLPRAWVTSAFTLGQWPEVAGLVVLPWMFRRLGVRGTLAVGVAAWVVRYGSLVADPPLWLAVAGIPLHGVGIACFTIAGQVYVDHASPKDRRAGAQAFYTVLTTGLGSFVGNLLAGDLSGRFGSGDGRVFLAPFLVDLAVLIGFGLGGRLRPAGALGARKQDAPTSAAADGSVGDGVGEVLRAG